MKPIIYQILPRYWGGHFNDIDEASLDYFKSMGCSHLWCTGVIRHATKSDANGCIPSHPQIVKGEAGSPYAISDYYDVNPYLASDPEHRMDEFKSLVERIHSKGLKLIIDFVPNHVSRDCANFGQDDNTSVHWAPENDFYYYPGQTLRLPTKFEPNAHFSEPYIECPAKATGNNCFHSHPDVNDWYETVKLNYCDFHTATWDKMLAILKYWCSLGVDGFRCDMVELVPEQFLVWAIDQVKEEYPDVTFIAEVYSKESYYRYIRSDHFDYLYDKSGLYESLRAIMDKNIYDNHTPVQLWQSTTRITSNWQYLGDLQPYMLNFLENHDEQRIASDFFAGDAFKGFAAVAVSLLLNQAPFMLYYGQEVGERGMEAEGFSGIDGRTTIFDWCTVDKIERLRKYIHTGKGLNEDELALLKKYRELVSFAASTPAVTSGQTYDLCYCNVYSNGFDVDRHFAFLRYDENETYLVACNFSSTAAQMNINIPTPEGVEKNAVVSVAPFDYTIIKLA